MVFLVGESPAWAAVTPLGAMPDSHPRVAWFDRYAEARQGPETVDRISQTFTVGAESSLDLTGVSGDVRVTGGPGTEVRVDATKRVRHRDSEEAKRLLRDLRVEMTNINGRVEVRTVYPRRQGGYDRGISASVDYVVTVPAGTAVAVRTISGNVVVASVKGEVRIEAISGDVSVTGATNLALAKTVSGDVTVRDISGATTLTLATVSGSVIATGLKARSVECGSVSGDVHISGVQAERVDAKSVSGNIEFDGTLSRGGRYEFTSHSGDVRLVLPSGSGFELDANTFGGSIRSDLPVTLRAEGGGGQDRRHNSSSRTIRGSYGDGGAVLSVRSFSGSVIIVKK